jgi:hypothetical protein
MAVVALITWLVTAAAGFYMLFTWISKGGIREPRSTRFPAPVIFGHFGLAAVGLVIWIIYTINDAEALSWTAFILLLPVAVLGFIMLARWLPTYQASRSAVAVGAGADTEAATAVSAPERHFPIALVAGHGLFAVITLVLVLLSALEVGE